MKKILGIVGTAKNTGKTTTLSYLLKSAFQKELRTAITGIGYDGEEIDNITSLPKPRLMIQQDTIIVTSEACLKNRQDCVEILERTGLFTSLGEITIAKVIRPGLFVIAGPNKRDDLLTVVERIKNFNNEKIFVDGSLNRISPMYLADEIIFTTGASKSTDIDYLVKEMSVVEKIFSFPQIKQDEFDRDDVLKLNSVSDELAIEEVLKKISSSIYLQNIFSLAALKKLLNKNDIELVLHSPVSLLLIDNLYGLFSFLSSEKINLKYLFKPELKAVTINPFYPEYSGTNYTAKFIDESLFLKKMKAGLSIPVYNIKSGGEELTRVIF